MNDLEPLGSSSPEKILSKQGVTAVFSLAAGAFLFIMNVLGSRFPVAGIVLGAITTVIGIFALRSKDPEDRRPGTLLTLAGALELVQRVKVGFSFVRPLAGTLLSIGAVGFIALGIWNGIKFLQGLKTRS
jgi:uncharacterized membrane protein